jgi:hypothetical protein
MGHLKVPVDPLSDRAAVKIQRGGSVPERGLDVVIDGLGRGIDEGGRQFDG